MERLERVAAELSGQRKACAEGQAAPQDLSLSRRQNARLAPRRAATAYGSARSIIVGPGPPGTSPARWRLR
eukprot:8196631-Alexandrium_andersonii.AAC.1